MNMDEPKAITKHGKAMPDGNLSFTFVRGTFRHACLLDEVFREGAVKTFGWVVAKADIEHIAITYY